MYYQYPKPKNDDFEYKESCKYPWLNYKPAKMMQTIAHKV